MGIEVFAPSLPTLFRYAAEAFFEVITVPQRIRIKNTVDLEVKAEDRERLLVAWLNEFLFLFETEGRLFKDVDVLTLSENRITARARGEVYKQEQHPIKTVIKAVTYHELEIKEKEGAWSARIIFDL